MAIAQTNIPGVIAVPPKTGKLQDYQVYINDTDPNSTYFKVQKIPTVLASGKNYFLISGTDLLQPTTNVAVEVLDVNGKNLSVEIPQVLLNGTDRVVVITILPTDYYGKCTITILGEAIAVPLQWKGNYNVKWQTTVLCNPSIDNEDDAIFSNNPTISYSEIYDSSGSITKVITDKDIFKQGQIYSKVAGEKLSPLMSYQLYLINGVNPTINSTFTSLNGWYTGSSYIDKAYVSNNNLYISQSYGLFGVTQGVTQSFAIEANKVYTFTADFIGVSSSLGGSVASAMVYSGSNIFLYLHSTSSTVQTLTAEFSSSTNMSASIELTGQAFALQTVWANVAVEDLVSTSHGPGFTKDMEGGTLYISSSDMTIYPPNTPRYATSSYTANIDTVVNPTLAIVNSSFQAYNILTKNYERVPFVSGSYILNYGKTQVVGSNNVQNSYLNIKFRNLNTIAGSLKYIDLYKNPGNNYIGRYPLTAQDMLLSGSTYSSSADFTSNWGLIESGTYSPPISTDGTTTIRK